MKIYITVNVLTFCINVQCATWWWASDYGGEQGQGQRGHGGGEGVGVHVVVDVVERGIVRTYCNGG